MNTTHPSSGAVGTLAQRPVATADQIHRLYWATDGGDTGTGGMYQCNGVTWVSLFDAEDVGLGASLPLTGGATARITGDVYTANGVAVFARAHDNSADFIVLQTTTGDQVILGPSTGDRDCVIRSAGLGDVALEPGGTGVSLSSTAMVIGSLNGGLLNAGDGLHVVGKISASGIVTAATWEAWVDATSLLVNSWANFGAPFANIHYRRSGDATMLRLTGVIGGGANGSTAFTLPAGYRPTTRHDIGVLDGATGGLINVNVNADGTVVLSGTGRTQVSMDLTCPLDI